jgi:hypothetical protein
MFKSQSRVWLSRFQGAIYYPWGDHHQGRRFWHSTLKPIIAAPFQGAISVVWEITTKEGVSGTQISSGLWLPIKKPYLAAKLPRSANQRKILAGASKSTCLDRLLLRPAVIQGPHRSWDHFSHAHYATGGISPRTGGVPGSIISHDTHPGHKYSPRTRGNHRPD